MEGLHGFRCFGLARFLSILHRIRLYRMDQREVESKEVKKDQRQDEKSPKAKPDPVKQ